MKTGRPRTKWQSATTAIRVPAQFAEALTALAHDWETGEVSPYVASLASAGEIIKGEHQPRAFCCPDCGSRFLGGGRFGQGAAPDGPYTVQPCGDMWRLLCGYMPAEDTEICRGASEYHIQELCDALNAWHECDTAQKKHYPSSRSV